MMAVGACVAGGAEVAASVGAAAARGTTAAARGWVDGHGRAVLGTRKTAGVDLGERCARIGLIVEFVEFVEFVGLVAARATTCADAAADIVVRPIT
ncbi:MAG: hypothetical protein ABGY24_07230 [bacterium]